MMAVFTGAGECTKIDWQVLGLSLATLTFIGMGILVGLCAMASFHTFKNTKNKGQSMKPPFVTSMTKK